MMGFEGISTVCPDYSCNATVKLEQALVKEGTGPKVQDQFLSEMPDIFSALCGKKCENFVDRIRCFFSEETCSDDGMSPASIKRLVDQQRRFMARKAFEKGMTTAEYIREKTGGGGLYARGRRASWWESLSDDEKIHWERRFETVVKTIKREAPDDIKELIADVEKKGGGIRFKPASTEEMGADAYNMNHNLCVGKNWVLTAEKNTTHIFANIYHELAGHENYEEHSYLLSTKIIEGVLDTLTREEKIVAKGGTRPIYAVYQYPETEIYAELCELKYYQEGSLGDNPSQDVRQKLLDLAAVYSPTVARAIVAQLARYLVSEHSQATKEALDLFARESKSIFGVDYLSISN
ncbi:MAG: hypothetical protein HQM16_11545 [Deltaproteobacteria bacterium]|nr:hypothetical protein [Deltaproteobacteria bacterium]